MVALIRDERPLGSAMAIECLSGNSYEYGDNHEGLEESR